MIAIITFFQFRTEFIIRHATYISKFMKLSI